MSATKTSTVTSPDEQPSSPAQQRLNEADYPTISPTLQLLWKNSQSTGTYGCQREVYHPLSPLAEPSAVLFYDSDDSEDDYNKANATARSSAKKQGLRSRLDDALRNTAPTTRGNPSRARPRETKDIEIAFSSPRSYRGASLDDSEATTVSEMLPTKSPRSLPLPDSPLRSYETSPVLSPQYSPRRDAPGGIAHSGIEGKGRAVADAEAITSRLEILHIKATEYSEAITRPESNRQLARELDALFSKENRFNPKEAAQLEAEYQQKIKVVYDRRVAEEQRQLELERQEQERIRALEAAKKAAEEQRQREAAERLRREQEELERKRQEAEAAQARAEQERKQAEARKAAEDNERRQREALQNAQKQQADAAAAANAANANAANAANANAASANAASANAANAANSPSAPLQGAASDVYGRRSFEAETAKVKRVITNLKGLKQLDETFLKESGLKLIRRELIPKFGQLNGLKEQTVTVRDAIKKCLDKVLQMNCPSVPAANYLLQPAPQDIMVPITFVWIVNQLAKMAKHQLLQECSSKTDAADPIGVVIASVFADPKYCPGGRSFVDIFVARLLKTNPILRGEMGPDATDADRERLGWKKDANGLTESEAEYSGRMQALTAGFVAIAARDFGRSNMRNPYPTFNLWHVLATLVNSPPSKLTNTHYFVVNTIIFSGAKKLCSIYGRQAKKLIEVAVGPWATHGMNKQFQGAQGVQATGLYFKNQPWWNQ